LPFLKIKKVQFYYGINRLLILKEFLGHKF
jgi:hypothetical protein